MCEGVAHKHKVSLLMKAACRWNETTQSAWTGSTLDCSDVYSSKQFTPYHWPYHYLSHIIRIAFVHIYAVDYTRMSNMFWCRWMQALPKGCSVSVAQSWDVSMASWLCSAQQWPPTHMLSQPCAAYQPLYVVCTHSTGSTMVPSLPCTPVLS